MKFLFDLLPVILFFVAYQLGGIYIATGVAIAASVVQVSWIRLRHGEVETMHKVTLVLLIVFGGLTLFLQDPVFIKWKPTLVNWLFAAAFIGSGWISEKHMIERMMGHAIELPSVVWKNLNMAWSVFFLLMGALNLYVAFNFEESTWVNFKLFGMMGLTLAFVVGQGFYLARYLQPEQEQE